MFIKKTLDITTKFSLNWKDVSKVLDPFIDTDTGLIWVAVGYPNASDTNENLFTMISI